MTNPTRYVELVALLLEVEQLITDDSDDLGHHVQLVPMRQETVARLRLALAGVNPIDALLAQRRLSTKGVR